MGAIVVGVDESEGARDAFRWAVREAELRGWTLTALMAWSFLDQHHASSGVPFDPHYGEAEALGALARIVEETLGEAAPGVELRAVCDLPARALVDASTDADLLVVGARGLGGFRSLTLGSVSNQVLHHARCPIAVVRSRKGSPRADFGRVVAGFDGSEGGRHALRWAVDEATARGAILTVVHAWHTPYGGGSLIPPPVDASFFEDAGRKIVELALAEVDIPPDLRIERALVEGSVAPVVLEAAASADLVTIGSRGLGGFRGLLLGSVSQQVAQHAPCPVVVVPPSPPGTAREQHTA